MIGMITIQSSRGILRGRGRGGKGGGGEGRRERRIILRNMRRRKTLSRRAGRIIKKDNLKHKNDTSNK